MSARTLKVQSPHMQGDDVKLWQDTLNRELRRWGAPGNTLKEDGVYGVGTRAVSSDVLRGLGIAQTEMVHGITPALRVKVRNRKLTPVERCRFVARKAIRERIVRGHTPVAPPLAKVIADSWGWHPGVHDGIDLICPPRAPLHSMVDGTVVRVNTGGWWGKAPSGDVSRGDGIIIVRCEVNAGPFRKGMNICYGHAEQPKVQMGQWVKAGEVIGEAGLAVAWHIHLMVNDDAPVNGLVRGVGDRDPRPFYDYARKHA